MGGKHLTISCTLAKNGYGVISQALIDSGANGFVFINTCCAVDIAKFLGLKTQRLPRAVPVKGYDGQRGQPVTHYLRLHLSVDGRRQYNVPLLILDLGFHDLILGRKWLAFLNILVDVRRRRLIWPRELEPSTSVIKEVVITRESLRPTKIKRSHQEDADARDQAMELEDGIAAMVAENSSSNSSSNPDSSDSESTTTTTSYSTLITDVDSEPSTGKSTPELSESSRENSTNQSTPCVALNQNTCRQRATPRTSHLMDTRDNLKKMEDELKERHKTASQPYQKKPYQPPPDPLQHVSISAIHAYHMHTYLKRPDNEMFTTSLYEIDRILEERQPLSQEKSQAELLRNTAQQWCPELAVITESTGIVAPLEMPKAYAEFDYVASKEASNVLPPHRPYDHKIELEKPNTLGYSPLYKMTTAELEETKRYLLDNLYKGFIEPSQSPFAAPILFVKKSDGSLRFCIDYQKLNELTRKDRYPLPLIDEVLARLSRAQVFTKLDIRQAFHCIRMDPESEELTTFRTRYGSYKCKVLPFGLTNGPATYQRYMNDVLFDYLDDFCTAYLDNILIYSEDPLEHEIHVKKVLQRLGDAGLQVDLKKCEFNVTRTKYLGFIISTDRIEVDPEKVSAIVN